LVILITICELADRGDGQQPHRQSIVGERRLPIVRPNIPPRRDGDRRVRRRLAQGAAVKALLGSPVSHAVHWQAVNHWPANR
jgi:hypothetical protein